MLLAMLPLKISSAMSRPLSEKRIGVALNPTSLASGLESMTHWTPLLHSGAPQWWNSSTMMKSYFNEICSSLAMDIAEAYVRN